MPFSANPAAGAKRRPSRCHDVVSDTHLLFWQLTATPRLGAKAKTAFDTVAAGDATIIVPVIVLADLYFLNEKAGQPVYFNATWRRLELSPQFVLAPMAPKDVLDFAVDVAVPEMHDRIVAGLARRLGVACLTRDEALIGSARIDTVWWAGPRVDI